MVITEKEGLIPRTDGANISPNEHWRMYLSHPVRRMVEDPIEDESVTLVVRPESDDDEAIERLESELRAIDETVTKRLEFGSLGVETTETAVAEICNLDGIESIETDNTIGIGSDHHADM